MRVRRSSGKPINQETVGLSPRYVAKQKVYNASKTRGSGPKRSGRKAATRPSSRGSGPKRRGRR
jgi:hypothetical protein